MTEGLPVKNNQLASKLYLRAGFVVYAAGIDKDARLPKEIATKRTNWILSPQKVSGKNKWIGMQKQVSISGQGIDL